MKRNSSISLTLKVSSVFMLLTLFWLTLSIPFVYKAQQKISKEKIAAAAERPADEEGSSSGNPLGNTNEEKCSNNFNTLSEEYLHHSAIEMNHFAEIINHLHHPQEATYTAFHGELLCPPPNA